MKFASFSLSVLSFRDKWSVISMLGTGVKEFWMGMKFANLVLFVYRFSLLIHDCISMFLIIDIFIGKQ